MVVARLPFGSTEDIRSPERRRFFESGASAANVLGSVFGVVGRLDLKALMIGVFGDCRNRFTPHRILP